MSRYFCTLPVQLRPALPTTTGYLGEVPARTWVHVTPAGRVTIGDWTDPWEALRILRTVYEVTDEQIDSTPWPGDDPPMDWPPLAPRLNSDGTYAHLLSMTDSTREEPDGASPM